MEHCEHCKKTADVLFPCEKDRCPVAKAKPALNPAAAWPFPKLLTEDELATLIHESRADSFVQLGFGPSGAWLLEIPSNEWCRLRVQQIREAKEAKNV